MNRPAPRTLDERQQRAALANGDHKVAVALALIEERLKEIRTDIDAVRGRAARQADRLQAVSSQPEVRVQTSSEWGSPQEGAYDWIESAPAILVRARDELRATLSDLMA